MNFLVKLHRNGGEIKPTPQLNGFNVGNGTLVYVHNARHGIINAFKGNMFKIFDNSFNDPDNTEWQIYLGTYEGRTERFEAANYLHQRAALLDHEGKRLEGEGAGVKAFNAFAAVSETVVKAVEWQNTAANAIARWYVKPETKYFAAFQATKNRPPNYKGARIMHNQTNIFGIRERGIKNLAQIFYQNQDDFIRCL